MPGLSPLHDAREYDAVVATGEQVTTGLLAIALQEIGVEARSWQGWQIPIRTDDAHGKARIAGDRGRRADPRACRPGQVAVVAGFQGVGPDNRITTLGRGGSDTSAVALAAALKADRCDIYTDVDGVYTTDPRIVPQARKLDEDRLRGDAGAGLGRRQGAADPLRRAGDEGARPGAGAVQLRRDASRGTLVVDEDEIVEKDIVAGIAYSRDEAKITAARRARPARHRRRVFGAARRTQTSTST